MKYKNAAFSVVELLVAMGIASVVITTAVGTVGQIYFTQKKILISQDFYAESRFLMERLVQIARNNTIDYDRYFIEVGPSTSCSGFKDKQIPVEPEISGTEVTEVKVVTAESDSVLIINNKPTRTILGYPSIFYWDTNNDTLAKPDRNLGGVDTSGTIDPCAQAFNGAITTLYLINGSRNLQTAIRRDATTNKIEIQRRLGADTNNDGYADLWNRASSFGETCQIKDEDDSPHDILGDKTNPDFCNRAHDWTNISPKAINVKDLVFKPAPDRDPFLNFRVDSAQVHPHVFISMETELREPEKRGFDLDKAPLISLQSAASSRVFGDPRN